jgi:hypothetical protein
MLALYVEGWVFDPQHQNQNKTKQLKQLISIEIQCT